MKRLTFLVSLVLSSALALSSFGCRLPKSVETPVPAQPQNPVEVIQIFKGRVQTSPPSTQIMVRPGAGWDSGLPVDPHPANVQGVFSMADKVFLGIRFAPGKEVTFSKYTLLTRGTGEEVKIDWRQTGLGVGVPASDLGPFEGQAFPFFDNPLSVPREPGTYEIRAYVDDVVAASAVFEVKAEAVLVITIFPASGEFGIPPPGGWEREPGSYPRSGAVLRTFRPGDKFFLGMRINPQFPTNVTVSKYTLFSKGIGQEKELGVSSRDTGSFEPGSILFPAIANLWVAPNESGIHEIKVYSNNEVIASAVFEVVSAVSQNITPPTVFTVITAPLTLDGTKPGTDIPWGSVVYHWANGITEVYGPDNNRIFIAKDSSAAVIIGPGGGRAATHGYQVPSGARIDSQAMVGNDKATKIYMGDRLIMTIIEKSENFLY